LKFDANLTSNFINLLNLCKILVRTSKGRFSRQAF
jgi:hypothetical protein